MVSASSSWKKLVKPLDLRMVMVFYNFLCSVLSLYAVVYFILAFIELGDVFDMTFHESFNHPFRVYHITKWIELFDTVLMILRHKQRQISFLHVYHHSTVLLLSDLACNIYPWPPLGFMVGMNSFIHVFLYLYYGQSALYPGQRPHWKKRLTQLQIVQFLIGLIHLSIGYAFHGFCVYGIFYGSSMLFLFSNFYYWAFVHKKPSTVEKKAN